MRRGRTSFACDALVRLRKHRGYSAYALAKRAGLTIQTVRAIEKGADPKWETVLKLAQALDVTPNEFLHNTRGSRRPGSQVGPVAKRPIQSVIALFFDGILIQLREARGLSAYAVAQLAGLPLQTVLAIERGPSPRPNPKWSTVVKLADALKVTPDDFCRPHPPGSQAGAAAR
jgi:transcriptional regulator with XRE-family HTH domain